MGASYADIYLDRYKQLEEACREVFDLGTDESALVALKRTGRFKAYADDIDYCRTVRNFLQHNPRLGDEYPVEPGEKMVAFIDTLIERIRQRKRCVEIAVTGSRMRTCTAADSLSACMSTMHDQGFSHMPVLEGKRVVGVLDLHAVLGAISEGGGCIAPGLAVGEAAAYTRLAKLDDAFEHPDLAGEVYAFFDINAHVDELEAEFERWFRQGRRLGMAFLTQTGKPSEALLGLVTAWDVLGNPQG